MEQLLLLLGMMEKDNIHMEKITSHLLGYVRSISAEELEANWVRDIQSQA